MKSVSLNCSSKTVVAVATLVLACPALAQTAQDAASASVGEAADESAGNDIVVTGSFIAGTPEDAALPVDVIRADELQRRGNPSPVELLKTLPYVSGTVGDTNTGEQARGSFEGAASVNLRGLGVQRTLVLMNGRRVASVALVSTGVDVNLMPRAAIGRVEVLKDGAAATYGSDAIAGVVNYITRKDLQGLTVSANVNLIPNESTPSYMADIAWGWRSDRSSILLAAGLTHRGKIWTLDRAFNRISYFDAPDQFVSINPVAFTPVVGTTALAQVRDPGCAALGGVQGAGAATGANPTCLGRVAGYYSSFQDHQNQFNLYGEVNSELSDTTKFHVEAIYSRMVSSGFTGPGNPSTNGSPQSNTPFPGNYYIPASNPGLALLRTQFPTAIPAAATGVRVAPSAFRPWGLGGNPYFANSL